MNSTSWLIILIIGVVIGLPVSISNDKKQKKAQEEAARIREEEAKKMAERDERMRKYREEYDEYIKRTENTPPPVGPRSYHLSFDEWRKTFKKY